MTVTSTMSGPGDRVMLPPASVTPVARRQLSEAVEQSVDVGERESPAGACSDSSASRGAAPIAAMSLTLTASAL